MRSQIFGILGKENSGKQGFLKIGRFAAEKWFLLLF